VAGAAPIVIEILVDVKGNVDAFTPPPPGVGVLGSAVRLIGDTSRLDFRRETEVLAGLDTCLLKP